MSEHGTGLSEAEVRKVARLSRLELSEVEIADSAGRLGSVLGYIDRLRELDVEGVEPMAHPFDDANRLDDDVPVAGLPTGALLAMAPESEGDFVKVPKVIDDGGGA
ncbi:MAG: Asp-tRNA(Asn)/Glu-tRNA(Gln) amidotransferase subunit GatC [Phycisphaeraceae bacterium]|nr:Asp-tRNA(Asn)/Glu-tRNA(Gln) amidotransferase subunit GatC [Phycisphaeraceae bacterium]MCB9847150.1 Asp-tRNA(Asn)/Glu-tRNA(Gln) amidotransferase subunit GatC [Phycisphaeraceae bacterium]